MEQEIPKSPDGRARTSPLNGARSRGPKTDDGKRRAAANSLKHGFTSRKRVTAAESEVEFDAFADELIAEYDPASTEESLLVEDIIDARWRLLRVKRQERKLLNLEMARARAEAHKEFESFDAATLEAIAFQRLSANGSLQDIDRFERRFERSFHRASEALRKLRGRRAPETVETETPVSSLPENQNRDNEPTSTANATPARPSKPLRSWFPFLTLGLLLLLSALHARAAFPPPSNQPTLRWKNKTSAPPARLFPDLQFGPRFSMSQVVFELQATCPSTGARAGILHTPHGPVETPVFMPVGTQATVKGIQPRDLWDEVGSRLILGNTYHLYLRPGHDIIRQLGGLHSFMNWPGAILTDSGGFQVFSLSKLRKVTEDGVIFRSHLNGDPHFFSPESTIDVQLALGSDVSMVLDECLEYPVSETAARVSMERTLRWAGQAMSHYRACLAREPGLGAVFPIVQGSMFPNLRRECARRLLELDADGYAIGGLSVGEPRPLSLEMAAISAEMLPAHLPRYVMGVGMPEELIEYVALGVDMMDCVMPTRNARNGCLFTRQGKLIIKQAQYHNDPNPIDPDCRCYACRHFSRAYLRHLFQAGEMLYCTLSSIHNLRWYLDIMRQIRESIFLGTFPDLLGRWRSGALSKGA